MQFLKLHVVLAKLHVVLPKLHVVLKSAYKLHINDIQTTYKLYILLCPKLTNFNQKRHTMFWADSPNIVHKLANIVHKLASTNDQCLILSGVSNLCIHARKQSIVLCITKRFGRSWTRSSKSSCAVSPASTCWKRKHIRQIYLRVACLDLHVHAGSCMR